MGWSRGGGLWDCVCSASTHSEPLHLRLWSGTSSTSWMGGLSRTGCGSCPTHACPRPTCPPPRLSARTPTSTSTASGRGIGQRWLCCALLRCGVLCGWCVVCCGVVWAVAGGGILRPNQCIFCWCCPRLRPNQVANKPPSQTRIFDVIYYFMYCI